MRGGPAIVHFAVWDRAGLRACLLAYPHDRATCHMPRAAGPGGSGGGYGREALLPAAAGYLQDTPMASGTAATAIGGDEAWRQQVAMAQHWEQPPRKVRSSS